MPDSVMTTSIARPAELVERDRARRRPAGRSCRTRGSAPISASACAIGPPSVFRLSVPHSTIATVSGKRLPSPRWRSSSRCGLPRAVLHREGARDAERIEAVQIAAGRQHVGRAQQIAARRRAHVAAVQRVQDRRYLVIFARCDRASKSRSSVAVVVAGGTGSAPSRTIARRRAIRALPCEASRPHQHVDALCRRAASPTTCSPCGMRVYSSSSTCWPSAAIVASRVGRPRPARPAPDRRPRPAPGSAPPASRLLGVGVGLQRAPALERRLQVEQAAIQPGMGDRRRQIADRASRPTRRLAIVPSDGLLEA